MDNTKTKAQQALAAVLSRNDISATEFARLVGHGRSTIYDWLSGDAAVPGIAHALADALNEWPMAIEWLRQRSTKQNGND